MFTSRAEYRILLRQDNADLRLTERSHRIGLCSEARYRYTCEKYQKVEALSDFCAVVNVSPAQAGDYLASVGSAPITDSKRIADLVSRPEVSLAELIKIVPRGTIEKHHLTLSYAGSLPEEEIPILPDSQDPAFIARHAVEEVYESVEISQKYKGYIERERQLADKMKRLEDLSIPQDFDFDQVSSLSIECRQKLKKYGPRTIAQASRISGVSPSDISVLLVYFGR